MTDRLLAVVVDGHTEATRGVEIERAIMARVGADVVAASAVTEEEIVASCREADALLAFGARITRKVMAALPKCRVVSRYSVGLDATDVDAATEFGIVVANVPDYCMPEVATHTLALILACARNIRGYDADVRAGHWNPLLAPLHRIDGQTLGLLGFGRIAREVAKRAASLELRIIAYDPYLSPDTIRAGGAIPVDLGTLLSQSDFLSLHAPSTPENYHLLGGRELGMMKPTAWLVNTARGALVDERALVEALQVRRIEGAAVDSLEGEPPAPDRPLLGLNNVLFSPHAAFYSEESMYERNRRTAQAAATVLAGYVPDSIANPAVLAKPKFPLKAHAL